MNPINRYCIDTNVLIESKNKMYAFDIVPGYWTFLDQKFSSGEIFTSEVTGQPYEVK